MQGQKNKEVKIFNGKNKLPNDNDKSLILIDNIFDKLSDLCR